MGKSHKGVLEYKEIMDYLSDIELDSDQMDKVYEFLESQGIDMIGNIDAEEEVEKDIDLTLPEGINIDDPVRMYLKEIGKEMCIRDRKYTCPISIKGRSLGIHRLRFPYA